MLEEILIRISGAINTLRSANGLTDRLGGKEAWRSTHFS